MGFVWTLFVPILVVFIMKKLMSTLGLGNLFNPTDALSMAAGGAGRALGDNGATAGALQAGLRAPKDAATGIRDGAGRNLDRADKAAGLWNKASKLRKKAPDGEAGPGILEKGARALESGALAVANPSKTLQSAKDKLRELPARAKALGDRVKSLGAMSHGDAGGAFGQAGATLASAWATGRADGQSGLFAAARAGLDMTAKGRGAAGDPLRGALGILARAGLAVSGPNRENLSRVLGAASAWADPAETAQLARQQEREARALTAAEANPARKAEIIGAHWAEKMAETAAALRPGMTGPMSPLDAATARAALASTYNVSPEDIGLDTLTGRHFVLPSSTGRFPQGASPETVWAMAGQAVHWLPNHVKQQRPTETKEEYALRLAATTRMLGVVGADGAEVDMREKFGIKDTAEDRAELLKLAAGRPSKFSGFSVDVSAAQLRAVDATVAHLNAAHPLAGGAETQLHLQLGETLASVTGQRAALSVNTQQVLSAAAAAAERVVDRVGADGGFDDAAATAHVTEMLTVTKQFEDAVRELAAAAKDAADVKILATADTGKLDGALRQVQQLRSTIDVDVDEAIRAVNKKLVQLQSNVGSGDFGASLMGLYDEMDKRAGQTTAQLDQMLEDARLDLDYEMGRLARKVGQVSPPPATGGSFAAGALTANLTTAD